MQTEREVKIGLKSIRETESDLSKIMQSLESDDYSKDSIFYLSRGTEAQKEIPKILSTLTLDIENISVALESMLAKNLNEVDTISDQLDFIRHKLTLEHEQDCLNSFQEIRIPNEMFRNDEFREVQPSHVHKMKITPTSLNDKMKMLHRIGISSIKSTNTDTTTTIKSTKEKN